MAWHSLWSVDPNISPISHLSPETDNPLVAGFVAKVLLQPDLACRRL
jgi:hypothetical protein